MYSTNVLCVNVLRLLETILFVGCSGIFVHQQVVKYEGNLRRLFKNNFVMGILVFSSTATVCELSAVIFTFLFRLSSNDNIVLGRILRFLGTCPELITLASHVALLSMRVSFVLKQMGQKVVLPIKGVLGCFVFFGPIAFLSTAITVLSGAQQGTVVIVMYSSSALYGLCLIALDIVSTWFFWRYVRETQKNLGSLGHVTSAKSTDVIARNGMIIALISLVGSIFYDFAAVGIGGPDVVEWMWLGMTSCIFCAGSLWILMKIRLDILKQRSNMDKNSSLQNLGSTMATAKTSKTQSPTVVS
eukprot:TRINITY_DN6945_c0_g4_i1.p2 TRINITY_DN6945_c0_g4~~TRINITY_DN6945_c0_g4_i1.p2  ORF type:complete len:301 (+),score=54.61 TRINITY_DN6945_c0_g4_i1:1457-2359(+)